MAVLRAFRTLKCPDRLFESGHRSTARAHRAHDPAAQVSGGVTSGAELGRRGAFLRLTMTEEC